MEKVSILSGNKLIAKFMGANFRNTGQVISIESMPTGRNGWGYNPRTFLRYHESWDWLIPVVKECHLQLINCMSYNNNEVLRYFSKKEVSPEVEELMEKYYIPLYADVGIIFDLDIDKTYKWVVGFITWYNKYANE